MRDLALSLDLGTGGCKASLWAPDGTQLAAAVVDYETSHPQPGWNVQRVADWWDAVRSSIRALLADRPDAAPRIAGIGISGHSLGAVALDGRQQPIFADTPIWSDTRATAQADGFFDRFDETTWYQRTGNGFAPALYPIFKAAWYAEHEPEDWKRARVLAGSKDYVNLRLTGQLCTDHSYASGSGAYDLLTGDLDDEILDAARLDRSLFPPIHASTDLIGEVLPDIAQDVGLPPGIPVFAGGVDNSCMALGSRCAVDGTTYMSLGSSSWMNFIGKTPVLSVQTRPYVFAHVVPELFVSALSTFSSGTTMTWIRDLVAPGAHMSDLIAAATSRDDIGLGLIFLPMLAGGTPVEGGSAARGLIYGLELAHTPNDLVRAAINGVTLALRRSFIGMAELTSKPQEVLISGGGSQDAGWNQIYADALGVDVVKTSVDQQAAALGAAAIVFVGTGLWRDFSEVGIAHAEVQRYHPRSDRAEHYDHMAEWFDGLVEAATDLRGRLGPSGVPIPAA